MENFLTPAVDYQSIYENIINDNDISSLYFVSKENKETSEDEIKEKNIEELLITFEEESEKTISIKIDIMKDIRSLYKDLNKYEVLYLASDYINKYFYNLTLIESKQKICSYIKKI